jgi:uncharacterized protein
VGIGALVFAIAVPASAHVEVTSTDATQGGEAVLSVRVPNESATASTTRLQFQLPLDTPIATVDVQPHPGWSFKTITTKLSTPVKTDDGDEVSSAVSEIDWTADSAASAIKPGEFDQFQFLAGPLPDKNTLTFKAIQTYSDRSVVKWIEVPAPGSTTVPDHPAPVLTLSASDSATTTTATATKQTSNTAPVVLSIVALAVAAAALGVGVVNRARGRAAP